MQIETATERHINAIIPLSLQVQNIHVDLFPHIFKPPVEEELRDFFRDTLRDESARIFLARDGEHFLGYCLMRINEHPENPFCHARRLIYIEHICVDASCRHRGVGKQLLDEVRNLALQLRIDRIQLDFWTANQNAGRAFRAFGFQTFNENMYMYLSEDAE